MISNLLKYFLFGLVCIIIFTGLSIFIYILVGFLIHLIDVYYYFFRAGVIVSGFIIICLIVGFFVDGVVDTW